MNNRADIIICGSGSAGLSAATWLARCGVSCKILESRPGPLNHGQADGCQVRTVEILESFGLVDELFRDGYRNEEVAFWNEIERGGGMVRTRSIPATNSGLSHLPRMLLSQARFNAIMLKAMKKYNGQEVDYGYKVLEVKVDEGKLNDPEAYPVIVVAEKNGLRETFEAKYALGSDGAHSTVRKSLGFKMVGDSTDSIWGVMDCYPRTNFPDIRVQCVFQSELGTIVTIPREGGCLQRFYIELPEGTVAKDVKLGDIQAGVRKIMHPWQIDFAETSWWSAYPIGQRLADSFTKADRVFLTGDASHTHSPKAGQGMNVSFQDGYNIGWKLASVLRKQANPELLSTYVLERQRIAEALIKWDKVWTKQMASIGKEAGGVLNADGHTDFSEIFVKASALSACLTVKYDDSSITHARESRQQLAANMTVGMRLPSVQVVRYCDALPIQFVKTLPSDGRWRVVVFAGDVRQESAARKLSNLGDYLFSNDGLIQKYTPPGSDIDSFIEVLVVLSGQRLKIGLDRIPSGFTPINGKWQQRDLHKLYMDDESYHDGHGHAYDFYGVNPEKGAVAIIRPDNHVSKIVDFEHPEEIDDFFSTFAIKQSSPKAWPERNGHSSITNGLSPISTPHVNGKNEKFEFLFILPDGIDESVKREDITQPHEAYVGKTQKAWLAGGPLFSKHESGNPIHLENGSWVLLQASTQAEAVEIMKQDPFTTGKVWDWEKVQVFPVRSGLRVPFVRDSVRKELEIARAEVSN